MAGGGAGYRWLHSIAKGSILREKKGGCAYSSFTERKGRRPPFAPKNDFREEDRKKKDSVRLEGRTALQIFPKRCDDLRRARASR